ncbi:transporter substrate-binding domain-containing protein [Desulfovibrio sp. OttesenSCG-928-F07]|nr:transporter substrate-binding domain-containing protein [Desulfovibrio sp. OttesenSCG-928-F07]
MRKLTIALLLTIFAIAVSATAFAATPQQELVENSMINQAIKRGTLKIGVASFVPWTMPDKSGKLVGFEIDVATRLAKDLGIKPEFILTEWDGIIPALLTGKLDIIVGGMSIRADRALKVNFSDPYDYSGMDILAGTKKAAGFKSVEDFNKPEVVIALRTGASSEAAVKKFMPKAQIRFFSDESQAVQEVLVGRAHAMVSSMPLPAFQAIKNPGKAFTPLKKPFTTESIAFAVRKGDPDSLNVLNTWIRIVGNEGWLQERHDYWFNSTEWEKLVN